jgi:hypothetical protein
MGMIVFTEWSQMHVHQLSDQNQPSWAAAIFETIMRHCQSHYVESSVRRSGLLSERVDDACVILVGLLCQANGIISAWSDLRQVRGCSELVDYESATAFEKRGSLTDQTRIPTPAKRKIKNHILKRWDLVGFGVADKGESGVTRLW